MTVDRPRVYLDNNATTWPAPEAVDAMGPFLRDHYANPSSPTAAGRRAAAAIAQAREEVAALVDADPAAVVFTSGATEANNAALWMALRARPGRRRLAVSAVEHPCVWRTAARFRVWGYAVDVIPVDGEGRLDLAACRAVVTERTAVVAVMAANNETGVLLPVAEAAAIAHAAGALLHVDAVQAVGRSAVSLRGWGADVAAVSGHKAHGPKGVGALVLAADEPWEGFLIGGDQERGRRADTENVPGIVGLGVAAALARTSLEAAADRMARLRDQLERGIRERIPGAASIGAGAPRLPNTAAIRFGGVPAEALIARLDLEGVAVSSGSACAAGAAEPSTVLRAMGLPPPASLEVIRFSLSRYSVEEEIDLVLERLPGHVAAVRAVGTEG